MTDRTLTSLYDTRAQAEAARQRLTASGLAEGQVSIDDQSTASSTGSSVGEEGGFFGGLKRFFGGDDHAAYSEAVNRGGFLLTARVDDDNADQAEAILEQSDAVDFDAREQEYRASGWSPQTTTAVADTDQTLQLAEERLSVGKREVSRGGARVRSYVVETPVQEQITLREEHAEIERRPVTGERSVGNADALFQERTIEVRESAEEAVVAKEAFVREEVGIRKDVEERVETISDTVRHTEVDVERTGGSSVGTTASAGVSSSTSASYGAGSTQGYTGAAAGSTEGAFGGTGVGGEDPSFASGDKSIAMGGTGSVLETEEERAQRFRTTGGSSANV